MSRDTAQKAMEVPADACVPASVACPLLTGGPSPPPRPGALVEAVGEDRRRVEGRGFVFPRAGRRAYLDPHTSFS